MNEKKRYKGISISVLSKLEAILLICFIISLVIIVVEIISTHEKVWKETNNYTICTNALIDIRESSFYLSDECRQYLETEDYSHVYNYFYELNTTKRTQNAIDALNKNKVDLSDEDFRTALRLAEEIQDEEIHAMKLMLLANGYNDKDARTPVLIKNCYLSLYEKSMGPEVLRARATNMLSSSLYLNKQNVFSTSMNNYRKTLTQNLMVKLEETSDKHALMLRILISLVICLFAVVYGFIVIFNDTISRPISVYLDCIKGNMKIPGQGSIEMQQLATAYNDMYEKRAIFENDKKYDGKRSRVTKAVNNFGFNENIYDISKAQNPVALMYFEIDEYAEVKRFRSNTSINIINIELYNVLCQMVEYKDDIFELEEGQFAVFVFDKQSEDRQYFEKMFSKIHYKIQSTDNLSDISVSCGVAFSDISGFDTTLINNANVALFQAKDRGGDCVMFYMK